MTDEGSKSTTFSLLAKVGELMSLPAAYLFFAGFLYAYYYFSELGLPTRLVEIPLPFYPVYAFSVFMENWVLVVAWILAVGLLALLATKRAPWATAGLLFLFLVAFPGSWWMARERGHRQAVLLRNGLEGRRVTFSFKQHAHGEPAGSKREAKSASDAPKRVTEQLMEANAEGKLVLVAETTRAFYVLWQIYPDREVKELPRARLFMVPRDAVSGAEVKLDSVINVRNRRKDDS